MSVLFVFGAGASFGNPDCSPYPPPVGARLFPDMKNDCQIAHELNKEVIEVLESGDFEAGMELLWEKDPVLITPFQIELAKYFTKFTAGKNNFYSKLIEIIKKSKKKPVFSTTNYDLLLEQCINQEGYLITYAGLPVASNNISLLKIHGSCNFLPAIDPNLISGIGFVVKKDGGGILNAPIRPSTAEEARSFCENADSISPAIAVYSKGKQVLHCDDFVKNIQTQWKLEVNRAKKIFVIGLKVIEHDTHIWDTLAESKAWLGYVGLKDDARSFVAWSKKYKRNNSFVLANTFEESLPIIAKRLKS